MKVWKYETHFPVTGGAFSLELPEEAEVISFGLDPQRGLPVIWAVVADDGNSIDQERKFFAAWTGSEVPEEYCHYRGTVCIRREAIDGFGLVFHLFEAS